VDTNRVASIIKRAVEDDVRYLCLIPPSRALLPLLWKKLNRLFHPSAFEELKAGAPYYASLQVTLWERDHLSNMLRNAKNIWEFENSCIPGINHYAIIKRPPIRYVHVVEKGKWQPHAALLFEQAGLSFDPSKRQIHSVNHRLTLWINKLKFTILGYAVFKLKQRYKNRDASTGGTR
jgi:hypothetical protein